MRLISRRRLREFWQSQGQGDSKTPLQTWADVVEHAKWTSFNDVKQAYGVNVDLAYGCYIFDIGGNKYRLICKIDFMKHGVLTLKVCTHAEYDKLCDKGGKGLKEL